MEETTVPNTLVEENKPLNPEHTKVYQFYGASQRDVLGQIRGLIRNLATEGDVLLESINFGFNWEDSPQDRYYAIAIISLS
jgi:hypothetical protein